MESNNGLMASKPISVWNRDVKVKSFPNLFKALGAAIIDGGTSKWSSLGKDLINASAELGLSLDAGQRAWLLNYRALVRALVQLLESNQPLLSEQVRDRDFSEDLVDYLAPFEGLELAIDQRFFDNPKQSPLLEAFREPFVQWLSRFLSEPQAQAIANRLPSYFVFALHEEWGERSQDYAEIQTALDTPFTKAESRERAWQIYRAWLQRQVELPMFVEAFGLKSVFVEPNAYYLKRNQQPTNRYAEDFDPVNGSSQNQKTERLVLPLTKTLMDWVEQAKHDDAIRVICGGPGCGKSSFTKIMAAKLAEEKPELPVLFIPLHQFDPEAELVEAVGQFIERDANHILPPNPLRKEMQENKILLIFDGLDELALQDKVGAEVAQQFVGAVLDKLNQFNARTTSPRLLALISGRELVVQANQNKFRKEGQILHMLPYFLPEKEHEQYMDPQNLLAQDQRDIWWQRYGVASGQDYSKGMPQELRLDNLAEITAQPLLNYLVALSYSRGKLQISETSNLNEIYGDLLNDVYDRDWSEGGIHRSIRNHLNKPQFERTLEEIALAAWHGDGRTTTVREIENHCKNSGLEQLLQTFQEGAKQGVTRLLTAFYFRQSGQRESEKTFEFTHKSFGEYLTARRIVGEVQSIHRKLNQRDEDWDEGCDEKEALERWCRLCGPTRMDQYLFRFVCDEIRLAFQIENGDTRVKAWQKTLSRLMGAMLRQGMPMEKLGLLTFQEMNEQAKHAEEALLAVMNACARCTRTLSQIEWPDDDVSAFATWLARIQGQRTTWPNTNLLVLACLSWLDLRGCNLIGQDLVGATLNETNLGRAILAGVNLQRSTLHKVSLDRAYLVGANLQGAILNKVSLYRASLNETNLQGATLNETNSCRANLAAANLQGATLNKVSLDRASLNEVNLQGATLNKVSLDRASLGLLSWDTATRFNEAKGWETVHNIPPALKQHLNLS